MRVENWAIDGAARQASWRYNWKTDWRSHQRVNPELQTGPAGGIDKLLGTWLPGAQRTDRVFETTLASQLSR